MKSNIFEEFQAEKQKLLSIAHSAKDFGWIDESREKEIIDKINNDVLTLGVIGQMKCGKSTFLNAFVFGDTVLPSATTPMTASLSIITYGPEKKLIAEFYTPEEWDEQKIQASRSLEDAAGNSLEESKIKAAKELVAKAKNLPNDVNNYLGTTKEDDFSNLKDYVGADGKYVSITKSVKIYYPHEYLKGVEIVDTPGFNDPIVSREERTKEFLKKADVVLLMLYASRAFDATDKNILFKNVRQCGMGKILIGVNKYDIAYGNGETESQIISNVKEVITKACTDTGDDTISELVKENEPILLSAEMALMSQLPMSVIQNNESFLTSWNNACDNFEISSQIEMAAKSRINHLIDAIKKIIERDKMEILLKKPANAIKAAAQKKKEDFETQLKEIKFLIENLQKPDDELEEKKSKIERAEKRLRKKIDVLGDDITISLNSIITKRQKELEDTVEASCKSMDRIIEDMKRFNSLDDINPKLESVQNNLIRKDLNHVFRNILSEVKKELKENIGSFCENTEEILTKYLEDFEPKDFQKKIESRVNIENRNLFPVNSTEKEKFNDGYESLFEIFDSFWAIPLLPIDIWVQFGRKISNILTNNKDFKKELHEQIENVKWKYNDKALKLLNSLTDRKDEIIEEITSYIIGDLLSPIQKQLDNILNHITDKETALSEAFKKEKHLKEKINQFNEQYNQIYN